MIDIDAVTFWKEVHQYLCKIEKNIDKISKHLFKKMDLKWNTKWISVVWMLAIFAPNAQGNWDTCGSDYSAFSDFPDRCDLTSEGYPVSLRCPGNDVIQILSADYGLQGAQDWTDSNSETKNTNCISSKTKDIVSQRCNNKTECTFSFLLSKDEFPDPCPGTKKYLKTKYDCVKFTGRVSVRVQGIYGKEFSDTGVCSTTVSVFSCPGTLVGIGREETASIAVQPNPGAWTKDPLLGNDHVFFAPYGVELHEYLTWEEFIEGRNTKRYNLPHARATGNIVVYDKNVYYIKANSRNIIRYSLITMTRTKEGIVPLPKSETYNSALISLAFDEIGLWVTYPGDGDFLNIGLLDKDQLTISKTWVTTITKAQSLHTFFICGTLYSVNPVSGKVDYSFDTKKESGEEAQTTVILFDNDRSLGFRSLPSSRRYRKRSFLRYNASSISYNPRDRLLYLWDEKDSNAVYYNLHFERQINPEDKSTESESQTTTSSRSKGSKSTTFPRTRARTTSKIPSKSEPPKTPFTRRNFCLPVTSRNLLWPLTRAGDIAIIECPDGGGGFATWKCGVKSPTLDPEWDAEVPDLSACITWLSDIEIMYDRGRTDRSFVFESLKTAILKRRDQITGKWIELVSNFISRLLDDPTIPIKSDGQGIVKSAAVIVNMLFEKEDAWERFDETQNNSIANSLMNSLQKAAFLYADAASIAPNEYEDRDMLRVVGDSVLMQIEVRDQSLRYLMRDSTTTFPDTDMCNDIIGQCGSDVIEVSDDVIMRQIGPGSSGTVIFALYNGLEKFLSPLSSSGWVINSNIISAVLRYPFLRSQNPKPVKVTLEHKTSSTSPRRCMHWEQSESGPGNWSDVGGQLKNSNATHTECLFDSPSTFAVFVEKSGVELSARHMALEVATWIAITIAIVCLIASVVTFAFFKNLQNDRSTILKNLWLCLLSTEVIFLVGINQIGNKIACSVVAGLLHYFLLSAFVWMALDGIQLYFTLVELFQENSRRKWYYMAGYGIPAAIVGVSVALRHTHYGTEVGCFIDPHSNLIWSIVCPLAVICIVNIFPLIAAMYKIHRSSLAFADSAKISIVSTYLKGAVVLLILELLTWIFAVLWVNDRSIVNACLFCIFNSVQGIFVLVFHCLSPSEVRQEYAQALERFPCCRKLAKASYATNSMTFSMHYAPGRFTPNGVTTANRQESLGRQSRHPWDSAVTLPKTFDSSPISPLSANLAGNRDNQGHNYWSQQSGHFTINHNYEQRRHHEEEVFLPTSYEVTQPQVTPVPIPPNEIPYNRLQHHRHSEYHPQDSEYEMEHILPPARYRTGLPPGPRRHNRSHTMAQGCAIRTNPHFGPSSLSQSRIRDITPQHTRHPPSFPANGPFYWELDLPFLRAPGKTDFQECEDPGLNIPILPPNSIIQRLRNEMQQQEGSNTQFKSLSDSSRQRFPHSPSPPIRMAVSPKVTYPKKPLTNQKRDDNISEDEGKGSSFEDQENTNLGNRSDIAASRFATHGETSIISPSQTHTELTANNRRRSTNSESDDPIVTDCSESSSGSSFGRQCSRWSHQEMLV